MNTPKPRKFFLMPKADDADSYVNWNGTELKMADCEDVVTWYFRRGGTKAAGKWNLRKMRKVFELMDELRAYWEHIAAHGE